MRWPGQGPIQDHTNILAQILAELRQVSLRLTAIETKETKIMSALSDAVARIVADIKAAVAVIQSGSSSAADVQAAVDSLTAAAAAAEAAVPAIHDANPSAPAPTSTTP
jgi:hypothetical protein